MVERAVGQLGEGRDCVPRELSDVGAGELVFGGAPPLAAAAFGLARFCLIALGERVPDESTVRKLTRRLGAEAVHQLTRELIQKARCEKRFRPRAARIDSTVVEADIRYPTDSGLAADGRWRGRGASSPRRSAPSAPR